MSEQQAQEDQMSYEYWWNRAEMLEARVRELEKELMKLKHDDLAKRAEETPHYIFKSNALDMVKHFAQVNITDPYEIFTVKIYKEKEDE